jgi:pyruvate formate lyase activating enzyme
MQCRECGSECILSSTLPYCPRCIRERFEKLRPDIRKAHEKARLPYKLPVNIPDDKGGTRCTLCVNQCRIKKGTSGFCGGRKNTDGRINGPDRTWAYVDWYHDPLPTNCVADWVCAGSHDYGYKNLAVFYQTCTFDCLFCQNWQYRERAVKIKTEELVRAVDALTTCVCFFGGDPTPSALQTIEIAKLLSEKKRRIRICWETNGSVSPAIMAQWTEYALKSNGCIKIDFKTFTENCNRALCGTSNRNTLENIRVVARLMPKRLKPPLLIVSTLLIPGYIDEYELTRMAEFLSNIDRSIPWSFLGFHPHFLFRDMPRTSHRHADIALSIANRYGMKNTRIGNVHLLTG